MVIHDVQAARPDAEVLLAGYLFRLCADMLAVYCHTVGHPEPEAP